MSTPPKPRIFLVNTPTVERLVPALAVAIGLNESIMLLQIDFWIGLSDNLIDGQYWTYQSVREMKEKAFPYWSIATINRTVASLQGQGLIITGNHNKRKGDKTRWFALDLEGLKKLGEKVPALTVIHGVYQNETPITQNETPSTQNETTLPEITTETTQKKKSSAPKAGADAGKVVEFPTPKKERKPDPLFDAVREHVFGIKDANAEGGRIAKISNWLAGKYEGRAGQRVGFISKPAEPQHVKMFADYCQQSGITPPLDLVKFVENWRKWASSKRTHMTPAEVSAKFFTLPEGVRGFGPDQFVRDVDTEAETDVA